MDAHIDVEQPAPVVEGSAPPQNESEPVSLARRVHLLANVRAFSILPYNALETLAALMLEEHFPAGHPVVVEGELGDRMYLVVEGRCEATTMTPRGPTVLAHVEPGGIFGELALLDPEATRKATVTTVTPLRTLTLTASAFQDLLSRYPRARKIFERSRRTMLARKFVQANVVYRLSFQDPRRERLFLASLTFFVTFGGVRGITESIRREIGPFRDISTGGRHIHHLVWGILLLLLVGYVWLVQVGTGVGEVRRWMRTTSIVYGMGSALTLDEFALWLNLADVYWSEEGRASVDAVILFGSLLSVGVWGGSFWRALFRVLFRSNQPVVEV